MLIKVLTPNFKHEDDRGTLVQLVREGYHQVNVITSIKGSIRGNHYHKINTEAFYIISGSLQLIVEKDDIKEKHIFKEGDMFLIPELVVHSFEFKSDTTLVSMYSRGVEIDENEKDIFA